MKQVNPADYIFGYWRDGVLFCPLCFENLLGRVSPDSIVREEEFEAQFSKCHWCGWPLWNQFVYLTGYEEPEEKVVRLFENSLAV